MDGPLSKWCPAVVLSRQDGRHSAVALLLKAALIQVSDYRLLGASGSNFLFTNLFSIKFLYFFIISSLFPYFNLFVSIFIQSYVNIKLHVSTLLDTNNTQGMQLGRFKNLTPARFEYIYSTLFPLCHSN